MFLAIIELVLTLIILVVFVTQIAYPIFCGLEAFPFFKKLGKIERELSSEKQKTQEHAVKNEIEKERKKRK